VKKIQLHFDKPFLKTFQNKHQVNLIRFKSDASFLQFEDNELIPNFVRSLTPYYNADGQMDKAFFDVKREELLLI